MQADARALVTAQRNEIFDALIAPGCGSSRRRGPCLRRVAGRAYRYLIARNADEEGFYLVWDGPRADVDFTEDVYEACAAEALRHGLKPVYHVWSRFNLFWTGGVIWHQVPATATAGFLGPVTVHCFACEHAISASAPTAAHDRMEEHYQRRHATLIDRLLADGPDRARGRRGTSRVRSRVSTRAGRPRKGGSLAT